jgi:hypothetical protein
MGMFDEADEITLPFGSLHQFQTILMWWKTKSSFWRMNRLVKLSKMADFLGIRVADFTALWRRNGGNYACRRSSRDGRSAGGHASITLPLVDETMTVNKNFGKDAIFPRQWIDATSPLIDWTRSRRSRVRYYTY